MNGSDILILADVSYLTDEVLAADVNTTANTLGAVGHGFSNTNQVRVSTGGTLPSPLAAGVTYYVVGTAADTFQLSETSGGGAINLTTQGTGTHVVTRVGPPDYDVVASQRDVTMDEATAEINMSSKTSRNQRVDAGRYSATLTMDALYVPSDLGYLAIQRAMRNGTKVLIRRRDGTEGSPDVLEEAEGVVTSLSTRAPDQAEVTVSCSVTVDGLWEDVL